jgi:uncharacterized DUF497 family protein
MKFEWDPWKAAANIEKHAIPFERVQDFDLEQALVRQDLRQGYGELRWIALAPIDRRLHVLVFTFRGEIVRVISLRRANSREVKHYEEVKAGLGEPGGLG